MLKRNKAVYNKRRKKGQSTIEYLVLVAGVIAAMILFLKPNGPFAQSYNRTLTQGTNGMENLAGRLADSHAPSP